jgi:hypothetical protein
MDILTSIFPRFSPNNLPLKEKKRVRMERKRSRNVLENKEKNFKETEDVIYALCNGLSLTELDEYCILALDRLKKREIVEINGIIDEHISSMWFGLHPNIKKTIFFYVLSIDKWLQNWVSEPNHPNRIRPHLKKEAVDPFFSGLKVICMANLRMEVGNHEIIQFISMSYETVMASIHPMTIKPKNAESLRDEESDDIEEPVGLKRLPSNEKKPRKKTRTSKVQQLEFSTTTNDSITSTINKKRQNTRMSIGINKHTTIL